MPEAEIKRACVLGWPVNHSVSPRLHGYWLDHYKIKGTYEAIAVEPKDLKNTLRELIQKGFAGLNLTLPHKENAVSCVDEIDAVASRIGAVNTIAIRDGKLIGSNTDAYGFTQNLKSADVDISKGKSLVMGAGGAARAVCAGLLDAGNEVILINRTYEKAVALAKAIGGKITVAQWNEYPDVMKEISLLVNTTALGMKGQPQLNIDLKNLPQHAVVTDIVYNPRLTPLLQMAQACGNKIVDGLGMLLYQAQPGFEAWFGIKPEVTQALREHVLKGLA